MCVLRDNTKIKEKEVSFFSHLLNVTNVILHGAFTDEPLIESPPDKPIKRKRSHEIKVKYL